MDLEKCGRKSAHFFTDKQKSKKKTDENRILCKFALSLQDSLLEVNLRFIFDLISINYLTKILKQPSLRLAILTKM